MTTQSQSTIHYEQGKLCYQNKKFQEAIVHFTEAIRLKPDTNSSLARCYNARGVVYFYLGEFKRVIKDCAKALELDPDNANYHNCRGNAWFSLGKFDKAAEDFSSAIRLSPEASHGRYYNNRGSAYRRLKQFKEAIDDYSAAIQIDPKNGNYYNNRGNTYFDMGEFQLAVDDFTTALGLEPYSPKTRLTLAQAHEALAQEKRMKNSVNYQGIFSSLKSKKDGKKLKSVRKDRVATIYVSPAGVEITFVHGGLFKKKAQQSFQWNEDMKIELIDDTHVKLFLDNTRNSWVVITPCEATSVEEELIGRITTRFASYSTACLVAQHEGVCNEYMEIIKNIKGAQEALNLLEVIHKEAQKQKDDYVKAEKFELANKSKAQAEKMEDQIKQKRAFIENESIRAESVRSKAEAEAGPVLDMVQIMQNRVQELFHTRVKSVKDKYKVDDLELEEQLSKMQALVRRAKELCTLVARPISEIRKAMDASGGHAAEPAEDEGAKEAPAAAAADSDDEDFKPSFKPEAKAATPAPSSAAAPTPTPASQAASSTDHDSDVEDWDDIDENNLPAAFAPSGSEIFMTTEAANGMVTITPAKGDITDLPGISGGRGLGDVVMLRKGSLLTMAEAQKMQQAKMSQLEEKAKVADAALHDKEMLASDLQQSTKSLAAITAELEELRKKTAAAEAQLHAKGAASDEATEQQQADLANMRAEMALLRQQQQQTEDALRERDEIQRKLQQSSELLVSMNAEAERLKAELASRVADMEKNQQNLSSQLNMTAQEKADMQARVEAQNRAVEDMKAHLEHVNNDLAGAARDALEKSARLKELEQQGAVMAQEMEELKNMTAQERQKAEETKRELTAQLSRLENDSRGTLQQLEQTREEKMKLEQTVESQAMSLTELRRHLATLQKDLEAANDEKRRKAEELAATQQKQQQDQKMIDQLKEQSRLEELKRRELHNMIQEIKGNIRVYVRIRPSAKSGAEQKLYEKVLGSDDRGLAVVSTEESATGKGQVNKKVEFEFDRVFWPESTQEEVFKEISQLVQSALDGYKVCIFAYGQTGSGKTHTMEGPDNPTLETRGMIPRSVDHIFKHRKEMMDKGWQFECEASFLEIYMQTIRDLLSEEKEDVSENSHEIKMMKKGKTTITAVEGLTTVPVASMQDLEPLLKKAHGNRATGATKSNARSSRSHSVFSLRITGVHKESGQESEGILNLIDLAGSERLDKSQATGQRLEETKAINSSLTCLGDVIAALAGGAKHVPFRNSKLTYLLQDSFGGGSKTLMFINVAPEPEHSGESLCSLRFGAKVHECHIGTGKKNIKAAEPKVTQTSTPVPAAKKK